jgi:hypothetical protein
MVINFKRKNNMNNLHKLTPEELMLKVRVLLPSEQKTFIQVGVNEGIGHDIAINILKENDRGVFIEPMIQPFEKMKINKKDFIDSFFLQKAVLPKNINITKMNLFNQDPLFEGTTFSNLHRDRIIGSIDVETITPNKILEEYNITDLDFLFCDAEQLDHLIILDFLDHIKPNVLFFETCWFCNDDFDLELSDGNKVIVPSRNKVKEKLVSLGYEVIDYWENELNRREDILAIKNKFINLINL